MKIPHIIFRHRLASKCQETKNGDMKLGKQRTQLFFNTLLELFAFVCTLCVCVYLQVCVVPDIEIHLWDFN